MPSGFVAAPIQVPVRVSREEKLEVVGVEGRGVDGIGVAVGDAQADKITVNRSKERIRMKGSIFHSVLISTTPRRGLKNLKEAGNVWDQRTAQNPA